MINQSIANTNFLHIIDHMPGMFAVKDLESNYILTNNFGAKLLFGLNDREKVKGLTDFNIAGEASNFGSTFQAQDKEVLSKGTLRILDINKWADHELKLFLTTKTILKDDNEMATGTMFSSINLSGSLLSKIGYALIRSDQRFHAPSSKQHSYTLENGSDPFLTKRETECLFFLLRGKTTKVIANILSLSPKTIEYFIDRLKIKFNAASKYLLIDAAIQKDYLNLIPESLFTKQMSIIIDTISV